MAKKNILVIGIGENDPMTSFGSAETLVKSLSGVSKNNIEFAHFNDFSFHLYGDSYHIINERSGSDIADYDLVFFRDWFAGGRDDFVFAISLYLDAKQVPFINKEVLLGRSRGKLSQHVLSCIYKAKMPATFSGGREALDIFVGSKDFFGYPCIVKASNASRGRDNYLVNSKEDLLKAFDAMDGRVCLIQEYIPNNRDYRVLMFEDKVLMIIERMRPTGSKSHLNNTSQGAKARKVQNSVIPAGVMSRYAKISMKLGRTFTGIDIIENENKPGTYICLEVNNMPQMETGACVDEKLEIAAELLDQLARD